MKKKGLSLLLALVLLLGMLPATALAAGETVTVSIETKTIDGRYLVEPTVMELSSEDTVYTLVTKLAEENGLTVENATGSYITKIGDTFGSMTHGQESGWMIAINNDHDTWPLPALKDGDTVRACFTYKTYGYDIDLLDHIDQLRAGCTQAEAKFLEENPFQEEEGFLEDENSKFNVLSNAYTDGSSKLAEIDAVVEEKGYQAYLDDLGTMIWGPGSELDEVRSLNLKLDTALHGNEYIAATSGTIELVGNPTTIYAGRAYPLKGTISPENATVQDFSWGLVENDGDDASYGNGYISYDTFYPTKEGFIIIQMWHPDSGTGVLTTKFITVKPAPTEDILDKAINTIASKHTESVSDWWWAVGMSDYAAYQPDSTYKLTDEAKQAFVDSIVSDVVKNPTSSNVLANAINGLSALGYDPTDITAADGSKLNAVELLTKVDVESEKAGIWSYLTVPGYVLLACNQGDYETAALESAIIEFLLEKKEEGGGWSTTLGVDSTAMTLQGLAPYYDTNDDVKAAADQAVAVLAEEIAADGCAGNANSDAMVLLAMSALGIKLDDSRFVKDGRTLAEDFLSHYDVTSASFGSDYADKQALIAAVAAAELLSGKTSYNAFDFSKIEKVPAVATPDQGGEGGGEDPDPQPPVGDTMTVSFTLKTHNETWIPKHSVTVEKDATVADVFHQVLDSREGFSYDGSSSYIRSITYNGTTLGEFSEGSNSGWKYMVNEVAPAVGMDSKTLAAGDDLVWYYVIDYTTDTDRDEGNFTRPAATSKPETIEEDGQTVIGLRPAATADKNGAASVALTEKELSAALKAAGEDDASAILIAPVVKGEASQVTVSIPKTSAADMAKADLSVKVESGLADVTLRPEALAGLGKESGATLSVTVSAEETEEDETSGTFTVEVKVGSKVITELDGGLELSLPVSQAGPGTVLALVDAEGKETILKTALLGEGVVTARLAGSATVRVWDNAKEFEDLPDSHWSAQAVAFVSSRELFNGTGEGLFSPSGFTDRATIMTVLYRLSGDTVETEGSEWYAEGMAWAKEKGISDGTNPTALVSREQLAVMLWRYAGSAEGKGDLTSFLDGDTVSSWAEDGLIWAVGAGIITGDQNRAVNPQGDATRAEVAVMLQRFVERLAEV